MKGMLIPTNGNPVEIDIEVDEAGSTLHDLQRLVGGNIEPFDVIFGEGISLYVNEEGLFTCPPNRAVYATKGHGRGRVPLHDGLQFTGQGGRTVLHPLRRPRGRRVRLRDRRESRPLSR